MKLFSTFTGYFSLLLAARPSRLDLLMLLSAVLSAIASGVPFPLIGIFFGQLLNDFNEVTCAEDGPESSASSDAAYQSAVNSKILMIVYLAIAQFFLVYLHLFLWSLFGARLAQRLRESYLSALLRQEPGYFDGLPAGEVASRLAGDVSTIRSGTSEKVGICLASLAFFVTAYIVAFVKDAKLAGMLVSLVPAYFLMSFVGSYYIEKYSGMMVDYAAAASAVASEALTNVVVVQAFGAEARLEDKFAEALTASKKEGLKKAVAVGVQSGVLYFVAYAANGLAFWQGSLSIAEAAAGGGGTTVGATFTVIFILIEATLLLSQVAPFIHLFSAAVASFRKLSSQMERESLIDGTSAGGLPLPPPDTSDGFELRSVSFAYPSRPEVLVLDDVSLRVPTGKHTAIVGQSGSGKSTVASLVARLYDPAAGQVLYAGRDARDLNVGALRGALGLVQQQEPQLLDRSVLENIAHGLVGSPDPAHAALRPVLLGGDLAELVRDVALSGADLEAAALLRGPDVARVVELVLIAAKAADAHAFVLALPRGYATNVGAGGRLVSGGQKQRVALARALVRDPAVLVLDEATSALDSASEERVLKGVLVTRALGGEEKVDEGSRRRRTVLTIAHRLSAIKDADNIVVMHRGRVVEEGDHRTLMDRNGRYAELVRLQSLGSEEEKRERAAGSIAGSSSSDGAGKLEKAGATVAEIGDGSLSLDEAETAQISANHVAPAVSSHGGEDEEPETPSKSLWALARGYAPALRPHALTICVALLGSSIVGGAFSGEAVIFGNTVGALNLCLSPSSIRSSGSFYGLMFLVLAVVEFFANVVSWTGFGWVTEKVVYSVRVLSFRALFEQDMHWHQSRGRTPAVLLSYITRDGSALAALSGSVIGTLFSITVNLIAAIILTHIIAWRIALVCLALVPLLLGAGIMELRVLGRFEEKHEVAWARSLDVGTEAVSAIRTVAALSLEAETLATYRRELRAPRRETLAVTVWASLCQALTYFFGNCVNALAYWWGAKQIIAGTVTTTQFLIVVFSLLVSALLWSQMFALAPELSSARAAMARLLGLIEIGQDKMQGNLGRHPESKLAGSVAEKHVEETAGEKGSPIHPPSPANTALSVQFRDVRFSYPARPDAEVLRGLTLDIAPGSFCALVGPSGAGKSTIISLVERLYVAQSGSVLVDGVDVARPGRDVSFRNAIALVPQESLLFEGSVAFNVGLGAVPGRDATREEVIEACRLANVHEDVAALPEGYDTMCGPNGTHFSGGQKQRLAIARALVRKPRLLILDEPTSALDAESEKLLQDGLEKAARGVTVIAIAHRLHTTKKADCIFSIEDGVCVDRGTHAELMERSSSYRANVASQTVAE